MCPAPYRASPFLSCKDFPKRHCSFNLLHSRFQSVEKITVWRIASVEKVHTFLFRLIICAVRLPECPTIGGNRFCNETYHIKHKAPKNGSAVALRGYRDFNKNWEQVHTLPFLSICIFFEIIPVDILFRNKPALFRLINL